MATDLLIEARRERDEARDQAESDREALRLVAKTLAEVGRQRYALERERDEALARVQALTEAGDALVRDGAIRWVGNVAAWRAVAHPESERPCERCDGTGDAYPQNRGISMGGGCPDCDGTGKRKEASRGD